MMKHILLTLIISTLCLAKGEAQASSEIMIGFGHGAGVPLGDMSDRFGGHFESTLGLYRFGLSSNSIIGIEASYIYGKSVKEDVLASLKVDNKPLLGINSTYSSILLRQRGNSGYITYEKIFNFGKEGSNSGLKIGVGAGVLQHCIRLQDDTQNNSYLQGDYIKGYDRFTFGPALKQAIGYHANNESYNFNFSLMLEIEEGFTKNIRNVNFDTMMRDDRSRLDILINLKAKFYISVASNASADDIYY